jgi:hypothetical protein
MVCGTCSHQESAGHLFLFDAPDMRIREAAYGVATRWAIAIRPYEELLRYVLFVCLSVPSASEVLLNLCRIVRCASCFSISCQEALTTVRPHHSTPSIRLCQQG